MIKKFSNFNNKLYKSPDILSLSPEVQLFFKLIKPTPGDSVLSIGAESNDLISACLEMNLDMNLIEANETKLNLARREFGHRLSYNKSEFEDLPFEDNSFEYSFFFNSLGYSKDPVKALEESFRVTKNYTFIGVTNRYAIKGVQKTIKDFLYPHSHKFRLFSVWEIKQIIRELLGDVPVKWRTVSTFDFPNNAILKNIGYVDLVQKSPFGNFAGISVNLTPKFWLKPLKLPDKNEKVVSQIKPTPQRCREWEENYTKN
jgi:ubiquinone/menaquinone biosynthesis C-methylase UbiE